METVFITKYALSDGIREVPVVERGRWEGAVTVQWHPHGVGWNNGHETFYGKNWHDTLEAAVARAEKMRVAKLASLRKTITKLEARDFTKVKS